MKTRLKLNWLIVMVITLSGLMPNARAFYAPAEQRWINRDPRGESGFEQLRHRKSNLLGGGPNLFLAIGNDPINARDALGLITVTYHCDTVADPGMGKARYYCQISGPFSSRTCLSPKVLACLAVAVGTMNEGCLVGSTEIFSLGCKMAQVCLKYGGKL
jgi:hypothetical protein